MGWPVPACGETVPASLRAGRVSTPVEAGNASM
jgi:hypothetical protein